MNDYSSFQQQQYQAEVWQSLDKCMDSLDVLFPEDISLYVYKFI